MLKPLYDSILSEQNDAHDGIKKLLKDHKYSDTRSEELINEVNSVIRSSETRLELIMEEIGINFTFHKSNDVECIGESVLDESSLV